MEAKVIFLVLFGPLSALYDFCTNPAAPPAIYTAQFTEAFGHPPGANLPPLTPVRPKKVVYVTRP